MWTPPKPTGNYTPVRKKRPPRNNVIAACRDHDNEWEPKITDDFHPTDAPSGSAEKVAVLRRRVLLGQPLWHSDDRNDYAGLTGIYRAQ